MKPFEFLLLAQRLLENEKCPAGFRSAISRAYYAAFLHARDFLERAGIYLVTDKGHHELVNYLSAAGDPEVSAAAAALASFRTERNSADYHLETKYVETESHASQWCAQAAEIITDLNSCEGDKDRLAAALNPIRGEVARLRGLPPPEEGK
jgi:uncharacterized protein (UPF0332 family)